MSVVEAPCLFGVCDLRCASRHRERHRCICREASSSSGYHVRVGDVQPNRSASGGGRRPMCGTVWRESARSGMGLQPR
eukprot:14508749-Alexandrium_andersonii.AAC.1